MASRLQKEKQETFKREFSVWERCYQAFGVSGGHFATVPNGLEVQCKESADDKYSWPQKFLALYGQVAKLPVFESNLPLFQYCLRLVHSMRLGTEKPQEQGTQIYLANPHRIIQDAARMVKRQVNEGWTGGQVAHWLRSTCEARIAETDVITNPEWMRFSRFLEKPECRYSSRSKLPGLILEDLYAIAEAWKRFIPTRYGEAQDIQERDELIGDLVFNKKIPKLPGVKSLSKSDFFAQHPKFSKSSRESSEEQSERLESEEEEEEEKEEVQESRKRKRRLEKKRGNKRPAYEKDRSKNVLSKRKDHSFISSDPLSDGLDSDSSEQLRVQQSQRSSSKISSKASKVSKSERSRRKRREDVDLDHSGELISSLGRQKHVLSDDRHFEMNNEYGDFPETEPVFRESSHRNFPRKHSRAESSRNHQRGHDFTFGRNDFGKSMSVEKSLFEKHGSQRHSNLLPTFGSGPSRSEERRDNGPRSPLDKRRDAGSGSS